MKFDLAPVGGVIKMDPRHKVTRYTNMAQRILLAERHDRKIGVECTDAQWVALAKWMRGTSVPDMIFDKRLTRVVVATTPVEPVAELSAFSPAEEKPDSVEVPVPEPVVTNDPEADFPEEQVAALPLTNGEPGPATTPAEDAASRLDEMSETMDDLTLRSRPPVN